MTDRYAVIGNPVAHSRSPSIHAAFARQTGEDLVYGRIEAPLAGFAEAVAQFRGEGGRGLNVTLPFKVEAAALATRLTARARKAGAVNTLKFDGDEALGDNTDGAGLVADVTGRLGVAIEGRRVLLIGAGGAAYGVAGPLLDEHPAELCIVNRTAAKARALAALHTRGGAVVAGGLGDVAGRSFDVIVNATAASLAGEPLPVPASVFASASLAYDLVYADLPTAFMRYASERGAARVSDGLGMLVAQAAESFFVWRGVRPRIAPVIAQWRPDAGPAGNVGSR